MNRFYLPLTLAWLVSVCVGCTSAPVRYYTLTPPAGETLPASQTPLTIDVRVVHTPPQLSRSELMVRTGPAEVTLLENERWVSPVNEEIKSALRLELQRRLSPMSGLPPALTKLTLDIDVRHLESELGRYARFQASWSATLTPSGQGSNGVRVTTCTFQADERIHSGYAGIVEGYQREIAAFADAIAAALTKPAGGTDAQCQESKDH